MISIEKTNNKGFHIIITGKNNEILHSSENLKTRASCFRNILATARNFTATGRVIFYDRSVKQTVKYCWLIGPDKSTDQLVVKGIDLDKPQLH